MHPCDVVSSTIDFKPDLGRKNYGVQNVVIVAVDLDRSGIWFGSKLLMIVVKIGLAQPATIHHYLMASIDLQSVLCKVEEIPVASSAWLLPDGSIVAGWCMQPLHIFCVRMCGCGLAHIGHCKVVPRLLPASLGLAVGHRGHPQVALPHIVPLHN
eukprot:SAG31_NODE_9928_length_1209_cov_0.918919_1_plen_155_part_00